MQCYNNIVKLRYRRMRPMSRYDEAKAFRLQALDDLRSADCLLHYGGDWSYGNSAFLYQQGVEKIIKSVMVECNLTAKPMKKLRHMPLVELWDDLLCRIDVMALNSQDQTSMYQNVSRLVYMLKQIFTDSIGRLMDVWWKASLGLVLSNEEANKIQISEGFVVAANQFKILKDDLNDPATKSFGKLRSKTARNKFKDIVRDLDALNIDKILDTARGADAIKQLELIMSSHAKILSEIVRLNQQNISQTDCHLLQFLFWVLKFSIPVLKITPHEVLGRYPSAVDDKQTRDWYIERHNEMAALAQELKSAYDEILRISHSNFRPKRM